MLFKGTEAKSRFERRMLCGLLLVNLVANDCLLKSTKKIAISSGKKGKWINLYKILLSNLSKP